MNVQNEPPLRRHPPPAMDQNTPFYRMPPEEAQEKTKNIVQREWEKINLSLIKDAQK